MNQQCEPQCEMNHINTTNNSIQGLRNINIQPLSRGYVLTVGCQSVAISTKEQLKAVLNAYIDNPKQVEEDYYADKFLPKE